MIEIDDSATLCKTDDFRPTWLMIKQHNVTGLKYFCKTVKSDYETYKGSGDYWVKHLKEHGRDVSTIWVRLFTDRHEIYEYAMNFSIENDIVNAVDENKKKIWANQRNETGLDGGFNGPCSDIHKKRIGDGNRGKMVSEETGKLISKIRRERFDEQRRKNYSNSKTGLKNPSWKGYVTTPDGIFENTQTAAKYYNCTDKTILNRVRSNSDQFKDWKRDKVISPDAVIITNKDIINGTEEEK